MAQDTGIKPRAAVRRRHKVAVIWKRGSELRKARKALGFNKSQMVDLLRNNGLGGVNWGTYHYWEQGTVKPRGPYEDLLFQIIAVAQRSQTTHS